ncbi:hypothetical protein CYMTET_22263, partial [Cymbomonas tetramitiformis]
MGSALVPLVQPFCAMLLSDREDLARERSLLREVLLQAPLSKEALVMKAPEAVCALQRILAQCEADSRESGATGAAAGVAAEHTALQLLLMCNTVASLCLQSTSDTGARLSKGQPPAPHASEQSSERIVPSPPPARTRPHRRDSTMPSRVVKHRTALDIAESLVQVADALTFRQQAGGMKTRAAGTVDLSQHTDARVVTLILQAKCRSLRSDFF